MNTFLFHNQRMEEQELKIRVGQRLLEAIKLRGRKQTELADSVDWLTRQTLNSWIKGHRMLPLDKAILLAQELKCTPGYLLTLEDAPEADKRAIALLNLYKETDERGRAVIFRVAEEESNYKTEPERNQNHAA